ERPPTDPTAARLAILAAEDRRAATPRDLAVLRAGVRSNDDQAARMAVRAIGRLERPELIVDILPGLKHQRPEIRAEAANALAQAAQGWTHQPPSHASRTAADGAIAGLSARVAGDTDPTVRAAAAEALGRWPYSSPDQLAKAQRTLLDLLDRSPAIGERLGVARGMATLA